MQIDPVLADLIISIRLLVFDFDGVFTDNGVWVDENGVESVRCSRADGLGLSNLRNVAPQLTMLVLSTEENAVVSVRCRKLKLRAIQNVPDKAERLRQLTAELNVPLAATAYVGNDINDAGCLRLAGLSIVVADAHPDVVSMAKVRTELPGGHGAVREICDTFASCHRLHTSSPLLNPA